MIEEYANGLVSGTSPRNVRSTQGLGVLVERPGLGMSVYLHAEVLLAGGERPCAERARRSTGSHDLQRFVMLDDPEAIADLLNQQINGP